MKGDIGGRFDRLDTDLRAVKGDLADLKSDMKLVKWMVGFNMALTTGVLAKLLVG